MTFLKEGHVTQNSLFTVPYVSFTKKEREKDVKQERIVAKTEKVSCKNPVRITQDQGKWPKKFGS